MTFDSVVVFFRAIFLSEPAKVSYVIIVAFSSLGYIVDKVVKWHYDKGLQKNQYNHNTNLEDYKQIWLLLRDQSEKIVEMFASSKHFVEIINDKDISKETKLDEKRKLNILFWEASLWMPAEVYLKVGVYYDSILKGDTSVTIEDILIDIRNYLSVLRTTDDYFKDFKSITANDIISVSDGSIISN